MKSELSIMEKLQEVIQDNLNSYLLTDEEYGTYAEQITDDNVVIDYPEVENMRKKSMFYITPQEGQLDTLTTCSDEELMTIDVCIMCKRDKNESLVRRVFAYYTALYKMLKNNSTLDGYITFLNVINFDFYPAVNVDGSITAIITTLQLGWCKDWLE